MSIEFQDRADRRTRRLPVTTLLAAALSLSAGLAADAQTAGTVREDEFRSRWADYQVDRPPDSAVVGTPSEEEQVGLMAAFAKSLSDLFRTGPFQLRANLATGWEYSNEDDLGSTIKNPSHDSFFIAPALGFFYNREIGPVTVSARYSAGYVYYLDQSYIGAGNNGGIFSQTGGLDVKVDGSRSAFSSSTGASYGNGNDIESGEQRYQFNVSETLGASYVLTPFTDLGTNGAITYTAYSGGTVTDTNTLTDTGTVYISYVYSPKTTGRFELSAGQEFQSGVGAGIDSGDRWYYQALVTAEYLPSAKLNMSAGVGYGVQNDSSVLGKGRSGSHPVYRITLQYVPTEKTTASLNFGYEGVDVEPSLNLQVAWQFRLTTSASLSVYQNSNFSTYEVAQSLVTRGALASVQQRLFGRVDIALSGGAEQSLGYGTLTAGQLPADQKPYYFGGVSLLWELNSYLALQAYYRGSTGEEGVVTNQKGLRSQASVSFRLTF